MQNLTFEQIDALLKFIEFHTDNFTSDEDAEELNELVGTDVAELYDILTELRDETNWNDTQQSLHPKPNWDGLW